LKTASLSVVIVMAIEWTAFAQNASVKGSYQSKTSIEADESFESALLSSENGDSKSARLQLERAMDLWIRTQEPGKAAQAAVQLGDRYRNRKEYQAALSLYHLANNVKSISAPIKANALNAVARTYEELFVDDLAEHYFNQALFQQVGINDPSSKVVSLTGLAGIYQGLKNLEKSREYYKKQTEIDPENPIPYYAIASTDWLRMRDKAHPLSEEEKVQAIEEGLQYADKALEKNANYVDAMAYKNLLLRDKAAATKDPAEAKRFLDEADVWFQKALAARDAPVEKKAETP